MIPIVVVTDPAPGVRIRTMNRQELDAAGSSERWNTVTAPNKDQLG